jgi:hypothetical protein
MDNIIRCYDCKHWGNGVWWKDGFKMNPRQLPSYNEELYFSCTEEWREKIVQDPIAGPTKTDDVDDIRIKNKNNACSKFSQRTEGELLPEWVKELRKTGPTITGKLVRELTGK